MADTDVHLKQRAMIKWVAEGEKLTCIHER
jgi:hypothetical protein